MVKCILIIISYPFLNFMVCCFIGFNCKGYLELNEVRFSKLVMYAKPKRIKEKIFMACLKLLLSISLGK
jgi:hypothetical protein